MKESATTGVDARTVTLGILLTLGGVFLFSVIDALGKWSLGAMGVGQLLLFRSITGLVLLGPLLVRAGPRPFTRVAQPGLQILRMVLAAVDSGAFFLAVSFLPLADVVTFYLAGPIFVTVMAAVFLGERVGWRRWLAILVGFAGVVLALGPSASVASLPALIALFGTLMFSVLMIVTRHLRDAPDLVLVSGNFIGTAVLGAIIAPFTWSPVGLPDLLPVMVMGVLSLVAHATVNRSLKLAPASTVAPFHYTLIVWAALFGFLVFGDVPGPFTIAGAMLIIGAGLFIYVRERQLAPRKVPLGAPEAPEV